MITGDIERVLDALNRGNVRYLIAGGVAVVLHGHLRATEDLDLIVDLKQENTLRALRVLANLGFKPRVPVQAEDFAKSAIRESWIREKEMVVLSLEPLDFESAWGRRVTARLQDSSCTVLSLADLLQLKRESGRVKDLEDVRSLTDLGASQENAGER